MLFPFILVVRGRQHKRVLQHLSCRLRREEEREAGAQPQPPVKGLPPLASPLFFPFG
jgi:hypothetical protein